MKKSLRALGIAGAFALTSIALASATGVGKCHVYCANGTTAGPYWSSGESCCQDLATLCGAAGGNAYTVFDQGTPWQSIEDCYVGDPPL